MTDTTDADDAAALVTYAVNYLDAAAARLAQAGYAADAADLHLHAVSVRRIAGRLAG